MTVVQSCTSLEAQNKLLKC